MWIEKPNTFLVAHEDWDKLTVTNFVFHHLHQVSQVGICGHIIQIATDRLFWQVGQFVFVVFTRNLDNEQVYPEVHKLQNNTACISQNDYTMVLESKFSKLRDNFKCKASYGVTFWDSRRSIWSWTINDEDYNSGMRRALCPATCNQFIKHRLEEATHFCLFAALVLTFLHISEARKLLTGILTGFELVRHEQAHSMRVRKFAILISNGFNGVDHSLGC